ncbi:hypothetical protein [Galbibacter sp.]|uniref:hypothetical protein n=1 Tax=Galbibacter sp. TaxID=2918471 RepID=UPI003A950B66
MHVNSTENNNIAFIRWIVNENFCIIALPVNGIKDSKGTREFKDELQLYAEFRKERNYSAAAFEV